MVRVGNAVPEGSKRVKSRFTKEQIEVLEKLYAQCSKPTCHEREKILREQPILEGVDIKQLTIWFQNRRCRERQKKENGESLAENRKLDVANKLFREENDCLQTLPQLISEDGYLHNQFPSLTSRTTNATTTTNLATANSAELSISIADRNGLVMLAEEIRSEFLFKVTGTALNWKPIPKQKLPSSSSVAVIDVSYSCIGVASRVCAIVPFGPVKTIAILKDRASWSRNCRNMDVLATYPVSNGETIELIYTQYYAPTTMALARDFWTLRYTSILDDGSYVVCEKSISGSDGVPSSPVALEFVRGRMLTSGYMIHPCKRGSQINFLDHFDLEVSSVPEMARPLYDSSELVAKQMIVPALHYVEQEAGGTNYGRPHSFIEEPGFLRSFSHRLSRSFNDAINGFTEDGWILMNPGVPGDLIVSIRRHANFENSANYHNIFCVKSSVLLQNVFPAKLVMLLKERRSSWMGFNFDDHAAVFSRAACSAFPGSKTHNLSGDAVLLGHTNYEDEILEVIRFDSVVNPHHNVSARELFHLQISNGMKDTCFGACSELIFTPVNRTMPNDAVVLPSGFRIFSLDSDTIDMQGSISSGNIAATEASNRTYPTSLLVLAFQFPFETYFEEDVASMALKYVQHVVSSVKNISKEAMPSGSAPIMNSNEENPATGLKYVQHVTSSVENISKEAMPSGSVPVINSNEENPAMYVQHVISSVKNISKEAMPSGSVPVMNPNEGNPAMGLMFAQDSIYALNMANLICQSYRSNLGMDMFGYNCQSADSLLDFIYNHQYVILCFSFSSVPLCLYANQSGLNMLETTADNLFSLTVDKIISGPDNLSLDSLLQTVMQQGYAILSSGYYISEMNRLVSYKQGVMWKVQDQDGSVHCLALALMNWSFI